ncbi:hypothetical protein AMS68_005158 [Peltaster fructicola]|uniref:GDP/GTP exchange factor Sec2 N-terminal domain-containing protein n=1 Tax=Peltaster fructicola TaxID=286661 RepID=A0A6H0XYA2_9PEZI|nr:hypothetical protein AMS68_005158 [Peltaster fructicola]
MHQQAVAFMKESESLVLELSDKQKTLEQLGSDLVIREDELRAREAASTREHAQLVEASRATTQANDELTRSLKLAEAEKQQLQRQLLDLQDQHAAELRSRNRGPSIMTTNGQQALQPPPLSQPARTLPRQDMPGASDLLERFKAGKASMKMDPV